MTTGEEKTVARRERHGGRPTMDRGREHWRIPYLYRDASNYKAFGACIVEAPGDASERQRLFERLVAATDSTMADGGFVPADVGLEMLHRELAEYSDGLVDDDHPWHELVADEAEAVVIDDHASVVPLEELVARFESASARGWPSALTSLPGLTGIDWHGGHGQSG